MADPEEQDYIPGTRVIRNLLDRREGSPHGTRDADRLQRFELEASQARAQELYAHPVQGEFGFSHYREVHRRLFQDVYAWAGDPRRVPMQKLGTEYAPPSEMNAMLRHEFSRLRDAGSLRGVPERSEFCRALADHWASINHAHAFREGNTRSQTVFFHQLAEAAGYRLDVARLSPRHPESLRDRFVEARFEQQSLRRHPGIASEDASLRLANVLYSMVEYAPGPEAALLRGGLPSSQQGTRPADPSGIESRDPGLLAKSLQQQGIAVTEDGFLDLG